jgi:acyl transferase domain-containing protein/NADPH:quinone reductase-like Zn-dependent oxidoreductase
MGNGHQNGYQNGHSDENVVEHLYVLSARSQISLQLYISSFQDYLNRVPHSIQALKNLAFTLGQRRTHFPYRVALVAGSTNSLNQSLQAIPPSVKSGIIKDQVIAYIFTGQGAQHYQMAAGLQRYGKFEQTIIAAEKVLLQLGATWYLTEELQKSEHESRVNDAEISQPACTAVQLALVALLQSWGVFPAAVLGHSSGEIAAAFAAGMISFEAAIAIAYFRGLAASRVLVDARVQGAMLAVGAGPEEVTKLFPQGSEGYAVIAAVNSYKSVTVAGDVSAIEYILERAEEQRLFVRRLKVGLAYHSQHMERVAGSYLMSIKPFCSSSPSTPDTQGTPPVFVSTVTGRVESVTSIGPQYWVQNLLQPVQYLKAVETLFAHYDKRDDGATVPNIIIEIGPHSALQSPTKQILDGIASPNDTDTSRMQVTCLPSLLRGKSSATNLLELAGKLFIKGVNINLEAINQTRHSRVQVMYDLPPYEWNKTARYVHRPRVGTEKLFSGEPYNKILGWKSPYTEGAEKAFRNVFTLDDLPWIRDHVVTGDITFPFTGFISLAIEGFRSFSTRPCQSVTVRELHVTTSLKIEEDQLVDITTKFRPAESGTQHTSLTAWNFETLSWSEAHGWTRHSYGIIEADNNQEPFAKSLAVEVALKSLNDQSLHQRNAQHEYDLLRENNGITYGPAFRNTTEFWQASGVIVHTMVLRQIEPNTVVPSKGSPVTVDPPTLDTILHSLGAIQERNGSRPIIVPSYCLQWRISNDIAVEAGQKLSVVSRRLSHDEKSGNMEMDFVVFDVSGDPPKPVAEIGPLKFQCIARPDSDNLRLPSTYNFKNVAYIDLMDQSILATEIEKHMPDDGAIGGEILHRHDLDQAALYFISRAMEEQYDMSNSPVHLTSFVGWAKGILSKHSLSSIADVKTFIDGVSASNATGELVCAVGAQLPAILRGEKQALEVMLEDGLLWRTYAENVAGIRANVALARFLERLLKCSPDLNILELGAGTASATLPVLEAIQRGTEGTASQFMYTFTDISAGFFDKARAKLSQWANQMIYSKLDISQDPLPQGFNAQSYDVILASNVLHATSDIVTTLKNVETLLKPGGKLVLMEGVKTPPPSFIPYALLPGWWLFEDDYRNDGPLLTKEAWDKALKKTGFSGLEGFVDDYPGQPEQLFSTLWSSKRSRESESNQPGTITLYHCSNDEECESFGTRINDALQHQLGSKLVVKNILQSQVVENDSLCVVLDGVQHSVFSDLPRDVYYKLKDILLKVSSLVWILPDKAHPDATMIKGLLRTLRLELPSSKLVLIEAPLDDHGASAIAQLIQYIKLDPNSVIRVEQEYSLINNTLHVPRLQLAEATREIFAIEAGLPIKAEQKVWQEGKTLELTVETVGSPDSVYFRHSDILSTNLGDEEIIVKVDAAGINFIDLLLVLGSLQWSPPGLEGAGIVTHVGPRVTDLHVGDRVFYAVDKAGMATSVQIPSACAHRIPKGLDITEAAGLPVAYSTALLCLLDVGRLQKGERILIHSASGAAGQACVQIAQHIGSEVFVTAGTPEKRDFLAQTYGISESHIFSSRTPEFKDGIMQVTNNRGVDVVVNCLSGHLLQQTWDLIAENGRFLEIGKKDFLQNSHLPMRHFIRNVTFSGIDLRRIINTKPTTVKRFLSTIASMVEEGAITPIRPITKIPISQIKTGLRKLQAGQNIGKIIITLEHEDNVLVERLSPLKDALTTPKLLKPDATYIIAGGTGGIGRALVPWMISKGAKNVIMLGRSASSNAKVKAILKQYEGIGICVRAIPCDVGSRADVIRASEAIKDLPNVRGVVHSAICLRVSL